MNDGYEPSPDFTARVMKQVHALEAERISLIERLSSSRPFRYALACGGTFIGVFGAVPAF
jgi:hypothetical protein